MEVLKIFLKKNYAVLDEIEFEGGSTSISEGKLHRKLKLFFAYGTNVNGISYKSKEIEVLERKSVDMYFINLLLNQDYNDTFINDLKKLCPEIIEINKAKSMDEV